MSLFTAGHSDRSVADISYGLLTIQGRVTGVIELMTGSNDVRRSGPVSLKYNVPYTQISPVVIACLQDDPAHGYGKWSDIESQVKVINPDPAGFALLGEIERPC